MKKLVTVMLLAAVVLSGCGKTIPKKQEVKSPTPQAAVVQEKKIFEKNVMNLKAIPLIEKVKLSWELESKDDVAKIEIMSKQSGSKVFKSAKAVTPDISEIEIPLYSFMEFDVKVRLISKDGSESDGVVISKIMTKMENVVLDKFEEREMQIYLPEGYENSDERYPVVYMHDGQNLFNKKIAPNGEWMIDETVTKLIKDKKIGKVIVVGIYNSSKRADEYVPYDVGGSMKGLGGKADVFAEYVVKKIIPYIDSKYRTIPDRENRAVMGSSFGGILSFWMGMKHSDTFSMIGAFSPSLWVNNGYFLTELATMEKKPMKIWIDVGTKEFDAGECRQALEVLLSKGYVYGKDVIYYEDNGAEHNEQAWAARAKYPLMMFKGTQSDRKIVDFKIELEKCEVDYTQGRNYFMIINPMGQFDDGMMYSLYDGIKISTEGKVKLEEKPAIIFEDGAKWSPYIKGNLDIKEQGAGKITVEYMGITKEINVEY